MSDRTYGKRDELKIKLDDQRKVLEYFQNQKDIRFWWKRLLNKELKKLINKFKLEEANTKIKLIKSEQEKKNHYHYQHCSSSFYTQGFCISGDCEG